MNWDAAPAWGSFLLAAWMAEVAKALLIKQLKTQHPFVWAELGEPSYFSKSSLDLVGRLIPYLNDPQGTVAADSRVRRLVLLRRLFWWLSVFVLLLLGLTGRSNMLTIYRSNEPFSMPLYAGAALGLMAIVAAWHLWKTRRHGD